MNKLFKHWALMNYCFQRIGMWDKDDLDDGVIHIFKIQITNLIIPIFIVPYIYFRGPSGIFSYLYVSPFVFGCFYFVGKFLCNRIPNLNLEKEYYQIKRWRRILNFFLGLFFTILCVLSLIFVLLFLSKIKELLFS